ncbi:hypothetical protein ACIRU3_38130 [Streptomyces sp. NPDC101151]|uniref:hypothetical protein n=1 Tax=Streptomyces sp. NPDC101151 TaxID=3366115 RepID=UPI0037F7B00D
MTAQEQSQSEPDGQPVRVRLRSETVIRSDLMYPGPDGRPVEEVRFRLEQYLGEVERAYAAFKDHP